MKSRSQISAFNSRTVGFKAAGGRLHSFAVHWFSVLLREIRVQQVTRDCGLWLHLIARLPGVLLLSAAVMKSWSGGWSHDPVFICVEYVFALVLIAYPIRFWWLSVIVFCSLAVYQSTMWYYGLEACNCFGNHVVINPQYMVCLNSAAAALSGLAGWVGFHRNISLKRTVTFTILILISLMTALTIGIQDGRLLP